jgi:hypothetical protein
MKAVLFNDVSSRSGLTFSAGNRLVEVEIALAIRRVEIGRGATFI